MSRCRLLRENGYGSLLGQGGKRTETSEVVGGRTRRRSGFRNGTDEAVLSGCRETRDACKGWAKNGDGV